MNDSRAQERNSVCAGEIFKENGHIKKTGFRQAIKTQR